MKQLLQKLQTGSTELVEVPSLEVRPGYLLIHTKVSLVSVGTERMLVDFAKANLVGKARQQPEKVKVAGDLLSASSLKNRAIFDPVAIQSLIVANDAGKADASYTLFSIMCIEMWCRSFIDAPAHQNKRNKASEWTNV